MVHLADVTKYYGSKRALGPVSFEIDKGDTVGFLGLNGVGKTTLLRILACGLRPSAGTVEIDGHDVLQSPHEVRKRVGYLPETPPVYGDMTVGDYLAFVGRIKGMSAEAVARRVPEVEEYTRVTEVHDVPARHLSQGYRQRVGVAQAIVHDPELLILDEPTHDLDPVQIVEMRGMIRTLKDAHTILISSHILPEISETCDRLLILDDGRIAAQGTEAELGEGLLRVRSMAVTVRVPDGRLPLAAGQTGEADGSHKRKVAAAPLHAVPLPVWGAKLTLAPGAEPKALIGTVIDVRKQDGRTFKARVTGVDAKPSGRRWVAADEHAVYVQRLEASPFDALAAFRAMYPDQSEEWYAQQLAKANASAAEAVIRGVPGVKGVERAADGRAGESGLATWHVEAEADLRAAVCRALVEAGHDVVGLARAERELERVFVGLVGGADA